MWHDVQLAARMLAKDRAFALPALVVLALGIAATNTVFTIASAVVLREPFEESNRLVEIRTRRPGRTTGVSYLDLQDLRERTRTFDGIAGVFQGSMALSGDAHAPERLPGAYVSGNVFALIEQQPLLGRVFAATDEQAGASPVIVLGHDVWQRRYGGDVAIVGQTIRVNRSAATVIGVMPPGFKFPIIADVWQPLTSAPRELRERRTSRFLMGVGRLGADVTLEQARQDLNIAMSALAREHPATNADAQLELAPFRPGVGPPVAMTVYALTGAVLFLLLIACANVANLLLARALDRNREMSVRIALGASRWDILRQLLLESTVLVAVAGVLAFALSLGAISMFDRAVAGAGGAPYWLTFAVDLRVFAMFAAVCVLITLLFSLAPAVHGWKINVTDTLNERGRGTTGALRARRWAGALVVVQLALTPVLLMGGGLMVLTLVNAYHRNPGIDTDGLVRMLVALDEAQYPTIERRRQFWQQLEERLSSVPGMRVGLANVAPLEGADTAELAFDGSKEIAEGERPAVSLMTVSPTYFSTIGVRLLSGRDFATGEGRVGDTPAIVNARFAALHVPGRPPLGARVRLARGESEGAGPEWVTIVGVVPNVRQRNAADPEFDPIIYVPYASNPLGWASILVREDSDLAGILASVRSHVRALDPDLPLFEVETIEHLLERELFAVRVFGSLFTIFAGIALVTAVVGLFAVTARSVAQRTREIGVRMALGAGPKDIWWAVSRRSAVQLAIGLGIGLPGAAALGGLLRGLTPLSSADPLLVLGVTFVLAGVSLLACGIPASRAIRLNPVAALRSE